MEPVLPVRALLGESPVWCTRTNRLFWVDIDGKAIHRTDPSEPADEVQSLPFRPGSIALRHDPDHLLVAAERALYDYEWSTGLLTELTEFEIDDAPTRMNDGRCDAAGRFWVGSMDDPAGSGAHAGRLYLVQPDLSVRTVEHGVGVSNALAFDADRATMYWADTRRSTIWAFHYDVDTGKRSDGRVFVEFGGALPGLPDGACIDADGCLWVACVNGWSLARITPDGTVDRLITLPIEKPTMPAFGGPRLGTMFVTSISNGGSTPAAPGQPLAGALLALDVGTSGRPEPVFAG